MKYDDFINQIVRLYNAGIFPGWTMTDNDCAQMRRAEYGGYTFIEFRQNYDDDEQAIMVRGFVDSSYYSDGELAYYAAPYGYDDIDEVPVEILCECVFEEDTGTHRSIKSWPCDKLIGLVICLVNSP